MEHQSVDREGQQDGEPAKKSTRSAKHDVNESTEDHLPMIFNVSRKMPRRTSVSYRQALCDDIATYVSGTITASPYRCMQRSYTPNMSPGEIEELYKIHQEPYVMLDVTCLEVFQYFRYVTPDSNDYLVLRHGLEAYGCSADQPAILVWHPRNLYQFNRMLVIDGNHRVSAMQDLYKNSEEEKRYLYRYVKAVVMDPSTKLAALEKLAQARNQTKYIIGTTELDNYRFLTMKLKVERQISRDRKLCYNISDVARILNGQSVLGPDRQIREIQPNSCHRYCSFLSNPHHEELLDMINRRHITVFPLTAEALSCADVWWVYLVEEKDILLGIFEDFVDYFEKLNGISDKGNYELALVNVRLYLNVCRNDQECKIPGKVWEFRPMSSGNDSTSISSYEKLVQSSRTLGINDVAEPEIDPMEDDTSNSAATTKRFTRLNTQIAASVGRRWRISYNCFVMLTRGPDAVLFKKIMEEIPGAYDKIIHELRTCSSEVATKLWLSNRKVDITPGIFKGNLAKKVKPMISGCEIDIREVMNMLYISCGGTKDFSEIISCNSPGKVVTPATPFDDNSLPLACEGGDNILPMPEPVSAPEEHGDHQHEVMVFEEQKAVDSDHDDVDIAAPVHANNLEEEDLKLKENSAVKESNVQMELVAPLQEERQKSKKKSGTATSVETLKEKMMPTTYCPLYDDSKQHPQPLAKANFVHGAVKKWDDMTITETVVEQQSTYLSAAVPEFGVHNTQIMTEMFYREGLTLLEDIFKQTVDTQTVLSDKCQQPSLCNGSNNCDSAISICLRQWNECADGHMMQEFCDTCASRDYKIVIVFYKSKKDELMSVKVRNCADKLNYCICIHENVRVLSNSYCQDNGLPKIISELNVAVMWSGSDLCYTYNSAMNMLSFELSALQVWLLCVEKNIEEHASFDVPTMPLLTSYDDVFPYSLFNHIVAQFTLKKMLRICSFLTSDHSGIHVAHIARLSGIYEITETMPSASTSFVSKYVALLQEFILKREPAYFCYGKVIQPCTFVDRFTFVYQDDRLEIDKKRSAMGTVEYGDTRKKHQIGPPPKIEGSFYLKWAGRKGFGVFIGDVSFISYAVLATYGGVVLCYKEANDTKQCYSLFNLRLSDKRFRKNDTSAIVDGTSIWAGDGKFLNHSCCPMINTLPAVTFWSNPYAEDSSKCRSEDLKILCFVLRNQAIRLPGMEVTVSYEDIDCRMYNETGEDDGDLDEKRRLEKKESRCVTEIIGGSFPVKECRCGYPFCAGDLARRYFSGNLRPEDYYLMFPHEYQAYIFMSRLVLLNQKYLDDCRVQHPGDPICFDLSDSERAIYI